MAKPSHRMQARLPLPPNCNRHFFSQDNKIVRVVGRLFVLFAQTNPLRRTLFVGVMSMVAKWLVLTPSQSGALREPTRVATQSCALCQGISLALAALPLISSQKT